MSGDYMKTKVKVMGNIAESLVKMRQFDDALVVLKQAMAVEPSIKTGFSILLCCCLLGKTPEDLKEAFTDLLKVDLEASDVVYDASFAPTTEFELKCVIPSPSDNRSQYNYDLHAVGLSKNLLQYLVKLNAATIE
jgi:hypothetical protein